VSFLARFGISIPHHHHHHYLIIILVVVIVVVNIIYNNSIPSFTGCPSLSYPLAQASYPPPPFSRKCAAVRSFQNGILMMLPTTKTAHDDPGVLLLTDFLEGAKVWATDDQVGLHLTSLHFHFNMMSHSPFLLHIGWCLLVGEKGLG